jgi:hypothetical protein
MHPQPLPGEASRRRAEEQFKTTKKVNSETKANTPSRQVGRENGALTRTSAGQGSSRQVDCKSRRRGSAGPEI